MAAIDSILARNAKEATTFSPPTAPKLCVVACDDSALTFQLEATLGLKMGEVAMIRLPAGGGALSEEVLQRAVAKAVYVEGCEEVLLLTHSSCTLYALRAEQLIDAIAKAGVPRSAIPFDLREMVGAGRDPRQAVRDSAQGLRRCAFLPAKLLVHVGHLDEATGVLQLVEHGATAQVDRGPIGTENLSGYQTGPAVPLESSIPPVKIPVPAVFFLDATAVQVPAMEFVAPVPDLPSDAVAAPTIAVPKAPQPIPVRQVQKPPPLTAAPPAPGLQKAVETVRSFMMNDLPKKERQWVKAALANAAEEGQSADALVKIALQPVLKSGNKRYKVIDEMILVKDELSKMPTSRAFAILRSMVE
jgi:carbonic anhydrase